MTLLIIPIMFSIVGWMVYETNQVHQAAAQSRRNRKATF